MRPLRLTHVVASAAVALSALAVCCGWPYEVSTAATTPDADPGDGAPTEDVVMYDVPTATCVEAGVKSGEAIRCPCGMGVDGGVDAELDGAPFGHQACNLEGGLGGCVGCPETTSCDGVTTPAGMVCVPGGVTTLGAANATVCPPGGCAVEGPEHPVAVSRFFLDEREVTVKRFRDWWLNGHVAPKVGDVIVVGGDGTTVTWREGWTVTEPTLADAANKATWAGEMSIANDALPLNGVDWTTALAFCMATGARLPTEAEWESAASGREGRLFPREPKETRNAAPTADMLPCSRAISGVGPDCGAPAAPTGPSERFSRDGVYDLVGSVAEWVLDVPPPGASGCATNCYPTAPSVDPVLFVDVTALRGVRGGAWSDTEARVLRVQARDFKAASTKSPGIGFRCAKR